MPERAYATEDDLKVGRSQNIISNIKQSDTKNITGHFVLHLRGNSDVTHTNANRPMVCESQNMEFTILLLELDPP